jgi:hypothetical protein
VALVRVSVDVLLEPRADITPITGSLLSQKLNLDAMRIAAVVPAGFRCARDSCEEQSVP